MRLLANPISQQPGKRHLLAFGYFAFAILVAYKLAQYVISDDLTTLAFIGMGAIGAAVVLTILKNWKRGLYAFLFWLLFEDLARKYLGNNMAIFFAKDFLVGIVYLSLFLAYRRREVPRFSPPFYIPLMLLVWFGVMQIFNFASPSIVYGILGMKLYFYYMPLLFVGYALVNSEKDLKRFCNVNLLLILVIVSLGIVQSVLGHSFLNPQNLAQDIRSSAELYRSAPISGVLVYRANGVFVSHGRYADFLNVGWIMVLGFSSYFLLCSRHGSGKAFLALIITFAGAVLAGSRGAFVWALLSAAVVGFGFFWGAPREGNFRRILRQGWRISIGLAAGLAVILATYPEALLGRVALYSETLSPNSQASELSYRTLDYPIQNFLGAFSTGRWQYGYGIGTSSLGVQYVARIFNQPAIPAWVESGFGTLIVELGILGLVLWLVMSSSIIFSGWRVVKRLKNTTLFPLGFAILWYAFVMLFLSMYSGMQAYQDFLLNAYLWLLLGVLFRLPTIQSPADS